jgi:hypothetical protein
MTDAELEQMLASLPIRAPDARREQELLSLLRTPPALAVTWWTRRIPLWQAAAACVAVFAASLIWLREPPGRPATPAKPALAAEPVIVRIDQPLFVKVVSSPERIDPSRWGSLPAGTNE